MKFPYDWKQKWISLLRWWRSFKKDANLNLHFLQDDIYEIDKIAHPYLRAFTVLLSFLVIASILIPIGFELTPELVYLNRQIEGWILFGFVVSFIIRLILTSDRKTYLKKRWFEGVISLFSIFLLIDIGVSSIGIID
jgi:hypothetical protein